MALNMRAFNLHEQSLNYRICPKMYWYLVCSILPSLKTILMEDTFLYVPSIFMNSYWLISGPNTVLWSLVCSNLPSIKDYSDGSTPHTKGTWADIAEATPRVDCSQNTLNVYWRFVPPNWNPQSSADFIHSEELAHIFRTWIPSTSGRTRMHNQLRQRSRSSCMT